MIKLLSKKAVLFMDSYEDYEKAIADFTKGNEARPKIHIIILKGAMLIEIMNSTTMH